jgi:hypothetical protein
LNRVYRTGTPVELKAKLQGFGIPSSIIPISDSGEVLCKKANLKWAERRIEERLHRRKLQDGDPGNASLLSESTREDDIGNVLQLGQTGEVASLDTLRRVPSPNDESESLHFVVTPSNRDILLGRGRLCRDHVVRLLQVFRIVFTSIISVQLKWDDFFC